MQITNDMSWSLRVSNGDLALDGGKLGVVSGSNKLLQDLRHYILERMGTDPLHPSYGSLLDGGTRPNGQEVPSPLGRTDWNVVALEIESEIRRIAANYQSRQVERAKADRLYYGKSTLDQGEILAAVQAVRFKQSLDALNVYVVIETGDFQLRNLTITLDPVVTI